MMASLSQFLPCRMFLSFTVRFFFQNFFVIIVFAILLYCYFRIFGIFPSFMVESSKKNKEHMEAMKGTSSFVVRN